MIITIDDVSLFSEKIIEYMKEKGITHIEIDKDFYWNISDEDLYDPHQFPPRLDLGQLSDDLQILMKAKENNSFIGYNFKHLASFFKYLSIKYPV